VIAKSSGESDETRRESVLSWLVEDLPSPSSSSRAICVLCTWRGDGGASAASWGRNESDRARSMEFGRIGSGREGDAVFVGDVFGEFFGEFFIGETFVGEVLVGEE
jgi:hypothetical protein